MDRLRYAMDQADTWHGTALDRLRIGNRVQVASGAQILLGGNHGHRADALTHHAFVDMPHAQDHWRPAGDTTLGHESWIGYEALLLPGVRIGTGAVVGARAVIAKDVPPFAVVVGSGRIVRYRHDPHTRKLLWRIRWWDWSHERIADALPLIQGTDVEALAGYAGVDTDVDADPDPITLVERW